MACRLHCPSIRPCFLLPSASSTERAHQFQTDREAQQHCPNDTVVWLNTEPAFIISKDSGGMARPKKAAMNVARKRIEKATGQRETVNNQ